MPFGSQAASRAHSIDIATSRTSGKYTDPPRPIRLRMRNNVEMPAMGNHAEPIGLDFGTTNSSVALVDGDSRVQLASFPWGGADVSSFRSVLYFEQLKSSGGATHLHALTGPAAIERYIQAEEKGRLTQSLKSHLASRTLTDTEVFGRRYKLEDLISRMLSDLRKHAERQFERPVRYA